MHDRIELKIPKFVFSLKKEKRLNWQLRGLGKKSDGQEISLKLTSADAYFNIHLAKPDGLPVSAEIDLKNRKITFIREETDKGEFVEGVGKLLGQVQLHVGASEMHFITGLKKQP